MVAAEYGFYKILYISINLIYIQTDKKYSQPFSHWV